MLCDAVGRCQRLGGVTGALGASARRRGGCLAISGAWGRVDVTGLGEFGDSGGARVREAACGRARSGRGGRAGRVDGAVPGGLSASLLPALNRPELQEARRDA